MGFDLDDRTDELLMRVQRELNVQLERQYDQLAQSMSDFVYSVFSDPHEPPWREELSIFSEYWNERGLRLTQRTLDGLERLIRDEVENADDRRPLDEFDARADESEFQGIFLAAAPRGRGGKGKAGKGAVSGAGSGAPRRGTPATTRFPKGNWIKGAEGNGVLELANPIMLDNGAKVTHVEFMNDYPILDPWALPDEDVVIAITGDNKLDQREARAMREQTRGSLTKGYTYHHDGNFTELAKHRGKKVFAGRMQAVPAALNGLLPHNGSSALARALGVSKDIAREVNELARRGKGPLIKMQRRIATTIARRVSKFGKAIPIFGGLITLYFFAEEVEAHGLGGALVRATPLLGDIVTAYDVGSEIAAQIEQQAEEDLKGAYRAVNDAVTIAHVAAQKATADAFNEIGGRLRITKRYIQPDEVLDALREPLAEFYGEVFTIQMRKREARTEGARPSDADIENRIRSATEKLEQRLKAGLQEPSPPPPPYKYG